MNALRTATPRRAATVLSLAAVAVVTACDRPAPRAANDADRSAVTRPDVPATSTAAPSVEPMRSITGDATDAGGNKVQDMAITTEVHTRLSRDPVLGALSIAVDTAGGRVVLRGSTPDTAARGRATELARGVDGVRAVDNELSVQPRP